MLALKLSHYNVAVLLVQYFTRQSTFTKYCKQRCTVPRVHDSSLSRDTHHVQFMISLGAANVSSNVRGIHTDGCCVSTNGSKEVNKNSTGDSNKLTITVKQVKQLVKLLYSVTQFHRIVRFCITVTLHDNAYVYDKGYLCELHR